MTMCSFSPQTGGMETFEQALAAIDEAFGYEAIRRDRERLAERIIVALDSGDIAPLPWRARELIEALPQERGEALHQLGVRLSIEEAAWRRMLNGAMHVQVSKSLIDALHATTIALQRRPDIWARAAA